MSTTHHHGGPAPSPADSSRVFALGILLNSAFVFIEAGYGLSTRSTALVADAVHNASDVLGLAVAWSAVLLARRKPTPRRTYGLRNVTILGALANALSLLVVIGGVAWEAFGRFERAEPTPGLTIMVVAACGIAINGVAAYFFAREGKRDANIRGAMLHLVADAAVSAGVVVAGAVIWKTGWWWVDPLASLIVSAAVLWGSWGFLRQTLHLALAGVPEGIDVSAVTAHLAALPGVIEVHDLHIWGLSTSEVALTAHLVIAWPTAPPDFLSHLGSDLRDRFAIDHTTVQLEPESDPHDACGERFLAKSGP